MTTTDGERQPDAASPVPRGLEPLAWGGPRASTLPASGAWRPGDPPGERQFLRIAVDRPFVLEGGGQLHDVTLAFETWGTLDDEPATPCWCATPSPATATPPGPPGRATRTAGWWDDLIGPGAPLDTDRFFVVCANVLGGCQGTTGPSSTRPDRAEPYGSTFPVVSIRDQVRTQAKLAEALGIARWHCVIGGSMGGHAGRSSGR